MRRTKERGGLVSGSCRTVGRRAPSPGFTSDAHVPRHRPVEIARQKRGSRVGVDEPAAGGRKASRSPDVTPVASPRSIEGLGRNGRAVRRSSQTEVTALPPIAETAGTPAW
jgi:hypothetical protein